MTTLTPSFLIGSSFFHVANKDNYKILDGFGIWQAPTEDLFVLERLKQIL